MTMPLMTAALKGMKTLRSPFWLMRQAGRYLPEYRALRRRAGSFLDLCLTPALAAEATLQPIRRFAPDAAIIFSDILIVPLALCQGVRFEDGRGPVLDPVRNSADMRTVLQTATWSRVEATYEAVKRVRSELHEDICLIGFAGSPWTVATYMVEGGSSRDFVSVKRWAYEDPSGFQELIDIVTEATIYHLSAQIDAGADVVKLFDSWAGVLSPAEFDRWSVAPTEKICSALKQRFPDIPIIGFPRGAGSGYIRYAVESGVDAIALDTGVSTVWAAEELQSKLPVQGNMDPVVLISGGEPMRRAVLDICDDLGHGPFIFNLGHGVLPQTPPEHVETLASMLRSAN